MYFCKQVTFSKQAARPDQSKGFVYLGNEVKCRINGIEFVGMIHNCFDLQFHPSPVNI
jgi:hypothetical protein